MVQPNFNAALLMQTIGRMSDMFNNESLYAQFLKEHPVLDAISRNQTAEFEVTMLDPRTNCLKHRAWWLIPPVNLTGTITKGCNIQKGNTVTSDSKEYMTEKSHTFVFAVEEADCQTDARLVEAVTAGLMAAKSEIRGVISEDVTLTLNALASTTNLYTGGGAFAGNEKTYPASDWNNLAKMGRYLSKEKKFNNIFNATLINGENLDEHAYNAMYNVKDNCCTDAQKIINSLGRTYWDDMFLEDVLGGDKASFLVDSNRVAILNSYDKRLTADIKIVNSREQKYGFTIKDDMFKINQNGQLVSATYEVKMQEECDYDTARNIDRMLQKYEVTARWSVVTAPGLDATQTGIIKLINA